MAEPVSSTGLVVGFKMYGVLCILALAAFLAWLIVIMTRMPRNRSEWVVSLVSTVIGSVTGGAFLVQKFQLHAWTENMYGTVAIGGIFLAAGLPVWAIVRWTFNFINQREDFDILQVIREAKKAFKEDDE